MVSLTKTKGDSLQFSVILHTVTPTARCPNKIGIRQQKRRDTVGKRRKMLLLRWESNHTFTACRAGALTTRLRRSLSFSAYQRVIVPPHFDSLIFFLSFDFLPFDLSQSLDKFFFRVQETSKLLPVISNPAISNILPATKKQTLIKLVTSFVTTDQLKQE